jgi:rod shape-determining protein MreD
MGIVRNILLIALALLLQTSWVHKIAIFGIMPDLILLALVYIGISGGQVEGTTFGFTSGFLLDVYDPEAMGINTLTNSIVGFAVGYSRIGVVAEEIRVQALLLFLAGILHDLIYFTLYSIATPQAIFSSMLRYGLGTAFYTACVGAGFSLLLPVRFNKGIRLSARRLHG